MTLDYLRYRDARLTDHDRIYLDQGPNKICLTISLARNILYQYELLRCHVVEIRKSNNDICQTCGHKITPDDFPPVSFIQRIKNQELIKCNTCMEKDGLFSWSCTSCTNIQTIINAIMNEFTSKNGATLPILYHYASIIRFYEVDLQTHIYIKWKYSDPLRNPTKEQFIEFVSKHGWYHVAHKCYDENDNFTSEHATLFLICKEDHVVVRNSWGHSKHTLYVKYEDITEVSRITIFGNPTLEPEYEDHKKLKMTPFIGELWTTENNEISFNIQSLMAICDNANDWRERKMFDINQKCGCNIQISDELDRSFKNLTKHNKIILDSNGVVMFAIMKAVVPLPIIDDIKSGQTITQKAILKGHYMYNIQVKLMRVSIDLSRPSKCTGGKTYIDITAIQNTLRSHGCKDKELRNFLIKKIVQILKDMRMIKVFSDLGDTFSIEYNPSGKLQHLRELLKLLPRSARKKNSLSLNDLDVALNRFKETLRIRQFVMKKPVSFGFAHNLYALLLSDKGFWQKNEQSGNGECPHQVKILIWTYYAQIEYYSKFAYEHYLGCFGMPQDDTNNNAQKPTMDSLDERKEYDHGFYDNGNNNNNNNNSRKLKPKRKSTKERVILSPKPKRRSSVIKTRSSRSRSRSRTNSKSNDDMRAKVKDEILSEIKGELLQEMKQKNEELLAEIDKLKTEIKDLNTQKAVESVHNEWPKLDIKDRASLRKKLAKEIKTHHNKRQKKVFKLEKNLQKKEQKVEKYKKEIYKLERQLKKHGVKYVGPPEEDQVWRLFMCQKYRSDRQDQFDLNNEKDEYTIEYERRYSITHQAVEREERQAQRKWAELFTDLIFVAIIVKFAAQVNAQYIYYTKQGDTFKMLMTLLNGLLFFLPFWCLWLELTVTLIRFHDFEGKWYGLVDDTLIFIVLSGIIEISFQIDINADLFEVQYANRFLLGFGLCIVALLLLHIFYRWKLYPSKRYTTRRIYSYSFAFITLFITLIDPENPIYIITSIVLSCGIMIYITLVSFRVHPLAGGGDYDDLHNHQYHIYCLESIVERFGIFSMIVIGESILALLIAPDPGSFIRYICVYFAFGLLFTFQLMYFGSHAEEGCHALHKIGFPGSVFWIFIHLPLSCSLLFVGIGLRLLVTFADLDTVPPQISAVLVTGTTLAIINYYILRRCHDKFMLSIPTILRCLPVIICPLCLFITLDSFGVILWCFIITVCSWFFDIILINEYETKPIWMTSTSHHGEFEFHPEEYNPLYLPIDSFLFCRNYDGEHGRTIVVSLAEYIIDDKTLQHLHEQELSMNSTGSNYEYDIAEHERHKTSIGVKVARSPEMQKHMPKSPKVYIDQISNKIDVTANIASFFKRGSISKSKSKKDRKSKKERVDRKQIDNDDADSTKQINTGHEANGHRADPSDSESDDPSVIGHNKTKGIPIPKNKKYRNGPKAATSIPPQGSPGPLAPFSPADVGIHLNINSKKSNNSVIIQNNHNNNNNNKHMTIPETPNDNSGSDADDAYTNISRSNSNNKRTSSSRSIGNKKEISEEEKKRQLAIKNYNKHHQTAPRVVKMDSNQDRSAPIVEPGLGVNHDAKTSIKLRSPAMNGNNLMQHNKNQMQFMDEDEDEDAMRSSIHSSSVPNTGLSAGSSGQIIPSESNITTNGGIAGGGSSENNLNLPVMPQQIKMTRSKSHEHNTENRVDWDSWVHEFEEDHEEAHEHRHQWFSEFADLVFVAIIINFADQIKNIAVNECVYDSTENYIELGCLTILISEAALFFLGFFTVWYELSVTIIRFTEIDGVFDDMLKFLYLGGIVTMTLQMDKYAFLGDNISGFTTGIIVCLLCITLLHIVYYFNVENCQLYCKKRIILYCISIIVLLVVSIINIKSVSFITIALLSCIILWISSNSFRVILTPNDEMLELPEDVFEHVVERWGLFVMIATGESILALIATTTKLDKASSSGDDEDHAKNSDIAFQHYIAILCAFGITYLISHYYLESSKINSMHFHALMHPGSPGSVMWTLLHGVLGFFLMMVGSGWKLCLLSLSLEICWLDAENYYNYKGGADYAIQAKKECCDKYHILGDCIEYSGSGWVEFSILLGVSLTFSLIAMYLLRTSHPKFIFSWKSVLCRFPIILMIPVGAYWTSEFETQSFYYSVWCLILMTIGYFVDHLFIDIYQTDIKPELRTFYNAQTNPEQKESALQLHLMQAKRKSLEFGRSHSLSQHGHSAANSLHSKQRSFSKSHSKHGGHH